MEVHQSLPAQYLHNPYMVKTEQPPSAPSTPPNEDSNRTVTQQRRPANGPVVSLSSCSADHRLYGHNNISAVQSLSPRNTQNGRPLTADRKRPYNCNMCSSRFGSKMELEEHQNSHTGQKPFECNMCKARFNRRSTLWNHKRIHSDDKPFECNVCRMTFKWKNSLKCHKEMHQRKNEITGFENDPNEKTLTYATAAKRRLLESHDLTGTATSSAEALQNGGPLITTTSSTKKRATKSVHSRTAPSTPQVNTIISNNSLSTVDGFIHPPLQTDGFFGNQKALSISDHKELDSLLNSTTRLSSMLKDESMFKPNICDDLAGFGNANSVFDTKQEMSLFHTNPFMVFGTHQLQPTMQNFAPSSLSLSNTNGACGEYFTTHTNQGEQMTLAQQPIAVQAQAQYSVTSSQTDMLMNHNVITYQPRVETPSLITPTIDYSITPTNIDYMIGSYPQTSLPNGAVLDVRAGNEHLQYGQQHQQQSDTISASERGDDGKEVPQVSW
uniref:C2H2-type domain-containing protein n=1 Tax=Parascaris univalens TaxID=6257 RepID=A0A914ZD51_PARUN